MTSELANKLDMSNEKGSYHLKNMENCNLIETYDIVCSEKGRKITVYGVSKDPLMLFFGSLNNDEQLRSVFSQLCLVIGPMAILIALKRVLFDDIELFT